jgi:hypothetical protein
MGGFRGVPYDPPSSSAGAMSTSGVPDRSAPSAPKPRDAELTVGKSAPAKQHSHASSKVSVPIRASLSTLKPLRTYGLKLAIQVGHERTLQKAIFPNTPCYIGARVRRLGVARTPRMPWRRRPCEARKLCGLWPRWASAGQEARPEWIRVRERVGPSGSSR